MAEPTAFISVIASPVGANKNHLTLWNASGPILRLYSIQVAGWPTAAGAGLVITLFAARIIVQPTGGTNATAEKADTGDGDPVGIEIKTGSAVSPAGAFGCATVSGEETASANGQILFDGYPDGSKPFIIRPGEGFTVRQGALASAGAVTVIAKFGVAA